ncbi:D-amino acid dehydrogenase [Halorhodospira halophila]|uniref:D-amino-acid dehydrogenase n=1 Tax=Halorhodospira halophila (strain DSM 244 / SL1) TaxID=349124 RepID=A1WY19_HALHL|nr:D-amino acid dehydrogenase [Halorhodospira halophila]ABM62581.1 D-amino-acid dehydrogenase [Halorhodospira halophila SL1]
MRIAVVGAGVVGTSVAWELTARGHQTVLIERCNEVAQETSFANGAQLHAGHAAPWNPPGVLRDAIGWLGKSDSPLRINPLRVLRNPSWSLRFLANATARRYRRHADANAALALYGVQQARAWRDALGLTFDARDSGILKLFDDPDALEHGRAEATAVEALGIRHRVLSIDETLAREPALSDAADQLAGAIEFPDDGCGDPLQFTAALAERLTAEGAELWLGTTARRLLGGPAGVEGVETSRGVVDVDAVVVAAGSYSPALTRAFGVRLPIEPVKGYSVSIPLKGVKGAPEMPIIDDTRKVVLTRLGDQLRIAGKAEITGFDLNLDERRWQVVRKQGLSRFPHLAEQLADAPSHPWAGLRPMTCDGLPILGPTPVSGLHLATGVGHLGWTFAAGSARLVADQLEERTCDLDPTPYQLRRPR